MANIQQVRYSQPQPNPWGSVLQSLGGMVGGIGQGYMGAKQQEQKNLMSLLPVLAQMKMLTPGGQPGQSDVISVPGGPSFTVGAPTPDAQDAWYKMRTTQLGMETGAIPMTKEYARMKATEATSELENSPAFINMAMANPEQANTYKTQFYNSKLAEYDSMVPGGEGEGEEPPPPPGKVRVRPKKGGKAFFADEAVIEPKDKDEYDMYDYKNKKWTEVDVLPKSPSGISRALAIGGASAGALGAGKVAGKFGGKVVSKAIEQMVQKVAASPIGSAPWTTKALKAASALESGVSAISPYASALSGVGTGAVAAKMLDPQYKNYYSQYLIPSFRRMIGTPEYQAGQPGHRSYIPTLQDFTQGPFTQ